MIAHPETLRRLVARYEDLRAHADDADVSGGQDLADVSYTLCISTGTRDIATALATAHEHIRAAEPAGAAPAGAESVGAQAVSAESLGAEPLSPS